MDEPVSGLDPKVTADFYELTRELNQSGITVIMVSHDLQTVLNLSSHILHIGKEEIFYGKTADYLKSGMAKNFIYESSWEEDK